MNSDKGYFKEEQTRADDVCNVMHASKEQRPDRFEIAAAAEARAKEEEANRKARKEKAEKQKELQRRAEEEKIAEKKRTAAEAGEALERKDAQKDAKARAAAKTAAERRSEERGAGAATQGTVAAAAAATDERGAAAHGKPSGRENGEEKDSQRLSNRTTGQREARGAKEKEIAAAEAGETSKEREGRKLAEARARAAEERSAKATAVLGAHIAPGSSQNEMHTRKESIVDVKSGKCGIPETHGSIKEKKSLNPTLVPYKNEKQERETNSASNDKQTLKERDEKDKHGQCNRNIKQGIVKEEDLVSTAENRAISQQIMGVQEEDNHGKQSGNRPKEEINEHSIHSENSRAEQNNDRRIITIQQNENARYKQEKEIVSVTGDERERSKESGSVKGEDQREAVAVMGDGSEKSESFRGGQGSYIRYTELNNQKKVQDTQMEENKQEHSHRYQNEQNSHDRGKTGDGRGNSHQDKHNRRNQQQHMPPEKRDGDFQYQQNHHSQSQKSQYYHKREQHYNSYHSQHHTQPVQQKLALQYPRALICGLCNKKYSLPKRVPRNLYCGHSVCTPCINMQICYYSSVTCPICPVRTWYAKKAEICPVNQPLVNILSEEIEQDAFMEENRGKGNPHFSVGNGIRQSQSHPVSDSGAGSGMKQSESKSVIPRSPHGSKCMEMGVRPSSYCVTCHVWVCVKCAEAEHSTKRCSLKPLKDQLSDMKRKHEFVGKRAHELLGKSLQSIEKSLDQDKIFLLWLKTGFDCIEKKQEDMKNVLQKGRDHMNTLADVIESLPRAVNLPEALAAFQVMDDVTDVTQQWTTDTELSVTGADQETAACLKHLMKRTLRSLQVKNGISEMFAVNKMPDGDLFSELRDEGGRFHLYALEKGKPTKQGTQALPLLCFKSCQAADSTLAFLDLSWGGITRGRLYIRLTGDTVRGRQFISLCTGEESISFRGTRFHRVWAKGKPGEHVWTGDYEKGDGSGGRSLPSTSSQEQVPAGREVPISAGLVAGRYEKKDFSSIFRIYTREEKEARDEAGFGQVEFGLDVLREVVRLKNISDVMISDCGLILEM